MNKSRAMFVSVVLLTVAFGGSALAGTSVSFMQGVGTGSQSAVFASYLVSIPNEDPMLNVESAISVSNVLMAPDGIDTAGYGEGDNMMGTLEIYLYNRDGSMMMHETSADSPGTGLMDGMLGPGMTYTVLLSELLGEDGGEFVGYGWVVANFDGVAGTRTVTIFGLGFNQHGDLTPAVNGQGGAGIKPAMMMDMMME